MLSQINPWQIRITYFPGVSTDLSSEFMALFLILAFSCFSFSLFWELKEMLSGKELDYEPTLIGLPVLVAPIFFISTIFLTHHVFGWPNIHTSNAVIKTFSVVGQENEIKWMVILWLALIFMMGIINLAHKRPLRRLFSIALGPFILNLVIMVTHTVIGIPRIIN